MKSELVVIADQQAAVNTFSPLVQKKRAFRFCCFAGVNPVEERQFLQSKRTVRPSNRAERRVLVAIFSLKTVRLSFLAILRTNGEANC